MDSIIPTQNQRYYTYFPVAADNALYLLKGLKGVDTLFYETLKEICTQKGTSPSAVCIALGISKSNVTEWKHGRSPKLDTVVKIAEFLSVNPAKLIPKQ